MVSLPTLIKNKAMKMSQFWPPEGVLPTSLYGGPCQYLVSGILQKQSYLEFVKNSFKKVNIWS